MGNRAGPPPASSRHPGGALDLDLRSPAEDLHQQGDLARLRPEADALEASEGPICHADSGAGFDQGGGDVVGGGNEATGAVDA